jgi:hypothetical protein
MKLRTMIPPRRTGVVNITGDDGQLYVFKADADGDLVCEVPHEPTVKRLLAQGYCEPFSEDDFEAAIALVKVEPELDPADPDSEPDDFSEELAPGGLPIESNTPPVRRKPGPKPKPRF